MKKWQLFLLAGFMLAGLSLPAQTYTPFAYWQFDSPATKTLDGTLNGHDFTNRVAGLNVLPGGPVGGYHSQNSTQIPFVNTTNMQIGGVSQEAMTIEFLMRTQPAFDQGVVFNWGGRVYMSLQPKGLLVKVSTESGVDVVNYAAFNGYDRRDLGYYTDRKWHHIALTFSVKTGRLQVYVDGVTQGEFTTIAGPTARINTGTSFYVCGSSTTNTLAEIDLDEVAIYGEELPAHVIYRHFQDALISNTHYSPGPIAQFPVPELPNQRDGLNPLDFAPGYPNVTETSVKLVKGYPGARYEHEMPQIRPFVTRYDRIASDTGSLESRFIAGVELQKQVVKHYNYYLSLGPTLQFTQANAFTDPNKMAYHHFRLANDPEYEKYPRSIVSNWGWQKPSEVDPAHPNLAYILKRDMTNDYYVVRDLGNGSVVNINNRPRWAWDIIRNPGKVDTLSLDGQAVKVSLREWHSRLDSSFIDLVIENGEGKLNLFAVGDLQSDTSVLAHFNGTGLGAWDAYQAHGARQFMNIYTNEFLDYIRDTMNASAGAAPPEFQWYKISHRDWPFRYDSMRTIQASRDRHLRTSPQFYPQRPAYWYEVSGGSISGIEWIVKGRLEEYLLTDSIFSPFISPGFDDGGGFIIKDKDIIRPGQYLGILKGLAMLGADTYTNFMFNSPAINQHYSNWRPWKLVMPAYAQGITSRIREFMYRGEVLAGTPQFAASGMEGRRFSYNTGNWNEYVTGRWSPSTEEYIFSGTIQKNSNSTSHGGKENGVGIEITGGDSIWFQIREQGSTYYFNKNDSVFFQLDEWHEWKEPTYWCKDFRFEAEVFDDPSNSVVAVAKTEVPASANPAGPFDFREFDTYLTYGSPSLGKTEYKYLIRDTSQMEMHVQVRVRSKNGNATGFIVYQNGLPVHTEFPILNTNWQWIELRSLSGLLTLQADTSTTFEQKIAFEPINNSLEFDRFVLTSGSGRLGNITGKIVAGDHCWGTPLPLANLTEAGAFCVNYNWDFGDGTKSYDFEPIHTYKVAGEYIVKLSVEDPITRTTRVFLDTIRVNAPLVDAGPDSLICFGDTIQMQSTASGLVTWTGEGYISNDNSLAPRVSPEGTTQYYLEVKDPKRGCTGVDSTIVMVSQFELTPMKDVWVCPGTVVALESQGGYYYEWDPHPGLSANNIPNPIFTSGNTSTDLIVRSWDACFCDTLADTITINIIPAGTVPTIFASQDTICEGDTLQLFTTGITNPSWSPHYYTTDRYGVSPKAFPVVPSNKRNFALWTWDFEVDGDACDLGGGSSPITLSVPIVVKQAPLLSNQDTIRYCPGKSVVLNSRPNPGYSYLWTPCSMVLNCNDRVATVPVPEDTTIYLSAVYLPSGCTSSDSTILIQDGILADTIQVCAGIPHQLQFFTDSRTISWFPGAMMDDSTVANPTITATQSQWFYATSSRGAGRNICTYTDSVYVQVNTPLQIITGANEPLCINDSIALSLPGADGLVWCNFGQSRDSLKNPTLIRVSEPATWYVLYRDSLGCEFFDSVQSPAIDPFCCVVPGAFRMQDTVINGPVSWVNEHFSIHDTLWIANTVTVSNTLFEMQPNAVIYILPGGTLQSNQNTFKGACATMWEGITIAPGGLFNSTGDTIQDAKTGVLALATGNFRLTNNLFDKNHIHLKVRNYYDTLAISHPMHPGRISGTRFDCSDPSSMLFPYTGQLPRSGIELENVQGIQIGGPTLNRNIFTNLGTGIRADKSQFLAQNDSFYNIAQPGSLNAARNGILASGGITPYGQNCEIRVGGNARGEKCYFDNVANGIRVTGQSDVWIKGNEFHISPIRAIFVGRNRDRKIDILENEIEESYLGIHMSFNYYCDTRIAENEITGPVPQIQHGIVVDDVYSLTATREDTVRTNIVDNILRQRGDCIHLRNSQFVNIAHNEVRIIPDSVYLAAGQDSAMHGIRLENSPRNRIHDNDVRATENVAWVDAILPDIQFWTERVKGIWFAYSPETDVRCNWIRNIGWGLTAYGACNASSIYDNTFQDAVHGLVLDHFAEVDPQGNPNLPTGNKWLGNRFIESKVLSNDNTNLLQTEAFYVKSAPVFRPGSTENLFANGALGVSMRITPNRLTSPGCRSVILNNRGNSKIASWRILSNRQAGIINELENWAKDMYLIESMDLNPDSLANDSILLTSQLRIQSTNFGKVHDLNKCLRSGNESQFSLDLNRLSPNCIMEINQKLVQAEAGVLQFEDSLRSKGGIEALARSCPDNEGIAVWTARSLLAFNKKFIWSHRACYFSEKTDLSHADFIGSQKDSVRITAYPNPSKGVFTIKLDLKAGIDFDSLQIFNQQGVEVFPPIICHEAGVRKVDLTRYSAGIYFVKVQSLQGVIYSVSLMRI